MAITLKASGDQAVLTFDNEHNTVVNSIRRTILDDVPTFAIEDVEIVLNESPVYDETIAHRLGLIPLSTVLKGYNFRESCKCGGVGCAKCEVKLSLKSEEEGYVLTSSLKSDDPKVAPADKDIPITKLFGEKKLEINSKAILGTGRDHAKWAPGHAYLKEDGKKVKLIIEPFGQLDSKDIYNQALDILAKKMDELEGGL